MLAHNHSSPTRPSPDTHHQTPVKRGKSAQEEPLTAESELAPLRSLAELDARELFEKFEQLVRVSVEEESFAEEEEEVARCLDYDHPHSLRLHFDPASSMKKKPSHRPVPSFSALNLFPVGELAQEPPVSAPEVVFESPVRTERSVREEVGWAACK